MTSAGILVVAEIKEGNLAPISYELMGCARKLAADAGGELLVVLVGSDVAPLASRLISLGASRVFVIDEPVFRDYDATTYTAALEKLAREINPSIILFGQTDRGRELAPALAFRLGTAANLDCLELAIDPSLKRLLQTRPAYGGNALATLVTETNPQMAALRGRIYPPATPDDTRRGEVINFASGVDAAVARTKILQTVVRQVEGVKLEEAEVVVSGGRGMGGPEGFKQLQELATLLGGAMGASRPPCDSGWVSEVLQVGITGKQVAPKLYIAVGISGSSQHLSGCSGSKNIVVINKNPEANFFRVASYGLAGDWKKVLPPLLARIKELTASA